MTAENPCLWNVYLPSLSPCLFALSSSSLSFVFISVAFSPPPFLAAMLSPLFPICLWQGYENRRNELARQKGKDPKSNSASCVWLETGNGFDPIQNYVPDGDQNWKKCLGSSVHGLGSCSLSCLFLTSIWECVRKSSPDRRVEKLNVLYGRDNWSRLTSSMLQPSKALLIPETDLHCSSFLGVASVTQNSCFCSRKFFSIIKLLSKN